ncbi:MAG: TetR/AcrR family transcriptional regulator [Chloroflexi bacterium]|nr:TetR/AcrR family transcriptional regulator [Chloroflexota bacterium]
MRKDVTSEETNGKMDQKIFAEAVRIFREKGYHATSMQNIADAVGLQKGSLYHYISSKEELLFKIFERSSGALTQQLEEIVASDESPTEKLRCAIDAHLTALCKQLDIYTVYLSERRALSGRSHAKVRGEAERHARLLEQIIQQGIDRKSFRSVDAKMAAHAILGMCNWLYQWYSPDGRLSPGEIAAIFSDLTLDGLIRRSK